VLGGSTALLGTASLLLMAEDELLLWRLGFASRASWYRVFRCLQVVIGERFEGESAAGGGVRGGLLSASSKAESASSVLASASIKPSHVRKLG